MTDPPLVIRLFGPLQVTVRGKPMPRVRTRSVEWLLALLALRAGREVDRSWLAGTLWPESLESRARQNVRNDLVELRKALGPEAVRLLSPRASALLLDLSGADCDYTAFLSGLQAGDESSLQAAVELYRGPLLEGCGEEWVAPEREAAAAKCLAALEVLAGRCEAREDFSGAVGWLKRAEQVDPFRDSIVRRLMEALAGAGDTASAIETYRSFRERLHRELSAAPDQATTELFRDIRARARESAAALGAGIRRPQAAGAAPAPSSEEVPHNLPRQTSSFIGREKELEDVRELVGGSRLVTLTGSGGCGKTRLALQAALEMLEDSGDGIWFVDLAPVTDAALVAQTAATALGLREERGKSVLQTLIESLQTKQALVVLDNCEHLLEASAALCAEILKSCPAVHILATSRERLALAGESTYRVPSLSLPNPQEPMSPEELSQVEAVRLFVERAEQAAHGFRLTGQNARGVASVCSRLDGIPLAIELAAARARSMTVDEIDARLDQRFRLLTGGSRTALPRQQTLQSLVDWSFDLLSEAEKGLLCRLSVFSGGWTLEAAEQVCSDDAAPKSEMLELLTSLLDKSLILADVSGTATRYHMLETIREYGRARLEERGEGACRRDRHLSYFAGLGEEAEARLTGADQGIWLERLEREHDNVRAALEWSAGALGSGEAGLRLCGSILRFWYVRGHLSEGRRRTGLALANAGAHERTPARGKALNAAGVLAYYQSDYPAARSLLEQSLSIHRESGDRAREAGNLNNLGTLASQQGDHAAARVLYERALALNRELGNKSWEANNLNNLGIVSLNLGEYAAARSFAEQALAINRELSDRSGEALNLNNLGNVARRQGESAAARSLYEQALALNREMGNRVAEALDLNNLGILAVGQGDFASARSLYEQAAAINLELGSRKGIMENLEGFAAAEAGVGRPGAAAVLWGAAERLREELGAPLNRDDETRRQDQVRRARATLADAAVFDAAWSKGRRMSAEEAAELALEATES